MIRFRMEWQDAPGVRDTVLARSWCRLVIETDGRLVTEAVHGASESLRGGIYGSAFPLGRWIVENWWFLLNESYRFPARYASRDLARTLQDRAWVQRHSLLAAREGGALPDLTLHRDEQKVVVRWTPDGTASIHTPLRFTGEGEIHLDVADAERGLAEAVQAVMDRLDGFDEPEVKAFRQDWAAITGATEQERRLCEWSARMGIDPFDPEELTDELAETLPRLVSDFDTPLRDDLLDAERPQTLQRDMGWLSRAEALAADAGSARNPEPILRPPDRSRQNGGLAAARYSQAGRPVAATGTAHDFGYACADALRQHLSPADGHEPIEDMDEILVRLGWAQSPSRMMEPEAESPLEAAVTRSEDGAPVAIVGNAETDTNGHRFRLARSIFFRHFSRNREAVRRLVTEAHTREQRASRAFAAEFLAPAAGLSQHLGGSVSSREIDELAHHYGIGALVIGHQIQNHRLAWISDS